MSETNGANLGSSDGASGDGPPGGDGVGSVPGAGLGSGSASGSDAARALGLFPVGIYLMTSCHEDDRSGLRVLNAMPCSEDPVLLAVAARKGHSIEPIIRDSHHFALCVVDKDDRLLLHKFPLGGEPKGGGDPFDALPHETLVSGCPVPTRTIAAFDCEVVRHFDLDADHEIYVGQILKTKMYPKPGVG